MDLRPYDPERDREALWSLKEAFELELGNGAADKRAAYADKLTDAYRERYLTWVERCHAESPQSLIVAVEPDRLAGYGFLLPESLAMIWDGAVLNELYVVPKHRGSGVAERLLDRLLDVAATQSLPMNRVLLDVSPTNDRARAFYERQEFEPWGRLLARSLKSRCE